MSHSEFRIEKLKDLTNELKDAQNNAAAKQAKVTSAGNSLSVETKLYVQHKADADTASANYDLAAEAQQSMFQSTDLTKKAITDLESQNKLIETALSNVFSMASKTILAAEETKDLVDQLNKIQPTTKIIPPLLMVNAKTASDDAAKAVTAAVAAYQACIQVCEPAMLSLQFVKTLSESLDDIKTDDIAQELKKNSESLKSVADNSKKIKDDKEALLKGEQKELTTLNESVVSIQAALTAATTAFGQA